MESASVFSMGFLMFIGVVLAIVLIVVWIVLPFAIIGTKPLLRDILAEAKRSNAHLANIEAYIRYMAEVTKESTEKRPAAPHAGTV